jgi:hypothetical protein
MTRDEFVFLLLQLADAWTSDDPERAAACFSVDVDYADPLRYQINGREELRRFFEIPEGSANVVQWHTILFDETSQAGAAEYSYEEAQRYHGVVLVRVVNGLISHWREYQHVSKLDHPSCVTGGDMT